MCAAVLSIRDFDSTPETVRRFRTLLPVCDRPRLRIPRLDLIAGKCYAVIGKSGAGKTVLNSFLLGLPASRMGSAVRLGSMDWWDGSVRIRGKDFQNKSSLASRWRDVRHRGTLLYLPQILPDGRGYQMSARVYLEQVLCALIRQAGDAVSDIGDPFSSLPKELRRVLDTSVTRLSGGERRRIELWARLAVLEALPKDRQSLLVLDEPTTGLDVPDERHYLESLRRKLSELPNLAVLVTTHALYFLDDKLNEKGKADIPLFDRVFLVHREPEPAESANIRTNRDNAPSCCVTDSIPSSRLCEAVMNRTPGKSVEDSMEDFVEWQSRLQEKDFIEQVENVYFQERP